MTETFVEHWFLCGGVAPAEAPSGSQRLTLGDRDTSIAAVVEGLTHALARPDDRVALVRVALYLLEGLYRARNSDDPREPLRWVVPLGAQEIQTFETWVGGLEAVMREGLGRPVRVEVQRDPSGSGAVAPAGADASYRWQRVGQGWALRFRGGAPLWFPHTKGFAYIHQLLMDPGQTMTAFDLIDRVEGKGSQARPPSVPLSVDMQALREVRASRVKAIAQRERAVDHEDWAQVQALEVEIAALDRYLNREATLGGTPRTESSPQRKARLSVTNAIRRAQRKIQTQDPELATYLKDQIRTGFTLRCRDRRTPWVTDTAH